MCPQSAEFETTPTERLADLLMLSHEPMFAWKLDGAIEFWNVLELSGSTGFGFPIPPATAP
jgi:hypothetical protein